MNEIKLGSSTSVDVMKLLEGRMLVVANSGGGKSYLIRVLCEQVVDKIPTIILDREGEFSTLREKHDVVLIGEGGEADAAVATAAKLARTLVELGVSAVVNLYDLSKQDKRKFVRLFLDALLNLPRSLWRPMFVVVIEAHEFCPEAGREAESRESVIRLMDSGRKRGICGILETQRFAKLAKDAAGEANNICVGRIVQDVDLRRASDTLGFAGKSEWPTLRELEPGEWFAYGPAFLHKGIQKFKSLRAQTTHPKPGQRHKLKPPAPSKAILKVAPDLAALKQAVVAEQDEITRLRAEVKELRSRAPARAQPTSNGASVPDARALMVARATGYHECMSSLGAVVIDALNRIDSTLTGIGTGAAGVAAASKALRSEIAKAKPPKGALASVPAARATTRAPAPRPTPRHAASGSDSSLGAGGMRRILMVLAQHPEGLSKSAIGLLARVAPRGGTFRTYVGKLRTLGYAEQRGELFFATDAGIDSLGGVEPLPSGDELRQYWLDWSGTGGQRRLLAVVLEAGERGIEKDDAATESDLAGAAGTFRTYLGKLRTANLVETFTRDGATYLRATESLR